MWFGNWKNEYNVFKYIRLLYIYIYIIIRNVTMTMMLWFYDVMMLWKIDKKKWKLNNFNDYDDDYNTIMNKKKIYNFFLF